MGRALSPIMHHAVHSRQNERLCTLTVERASPSLLFVGHLHGGRRIRTNIRRGLRPRGHDIARLQEHVPAALGVARRRRRCQQQPRRGTLRRRRVPSSSSSSSSTSSAIELDLVRPERVRRQHGRPLAALLPYRGARDGGDRGDYVGGSWREARAGGGGDRGGRCGGVEERRGAVGVGGGQGDQLRGRLRRRRAGPEGISISVARRERGQGDI